MNYQTKTNYILFNERMLPPSTHAILNNFRAYEQGRQFNEHGIVIKYSSNDIPGWIFRNIKEELGDGNELLRYVFPNFVNTEHYIQNRDSNVTRPSVPEPGQYTIPSPYVTPYLLNAVWGPLLSTQSSTSTGTGVGPSSDILPEIESAPHKRRRVELEETETMARTTPSDIRSPRHKRRRVEFDYSSGPSQGFRHSSPPAILNYEEPLRRATYSGSSRRHSGSQSSTHSQRHRATSTVRSSDTPRRAHSRWENSNESSSRSRDYRHNSPYNRKR